MPFLCMVVLVDSDLCCTGVKCGLLCKNDDRAFPKLSTHYTQSTRFGCNCYALELSKLYFYLGWTEYVLAVLTKVPEWVKGKMFHVGVFS